MLTRECDLIPMRALMPAPARLPSLSDALARRAAIFGPFDLDEPLVPAPGILARCAAALLGRRCPAPAADGSRLVKVHHSGGRSSTGLGRWKAWFVGGAWHPTDPRRCSTAPDGSHATATAGGGVATGLRVDACGHHQGHAHQRNNHSLLHSRLPDLAAATSAEREASRCCAEVGGAS